MPSVNGNFNDYPEIVTVTGAEQMLCYSLTTGDPANLVSVDQVKAYIITGGAFITAAANVGASGIATYDSVSGSVLNFRKVHAASTKLSVTLNGQMIDIDAVEANFTLSNIGGSVTTAQLPTVPLTKGGSGQVTKTASYDALSPTTTKGDIAVFNGTNNVRFAAGADGRLLRYNAAQAAGVLAADITVGLTRDYGVVSSPAFSTPRTPSVTHDTFVMANVSMDITTGQTSTITAQVDTGSGMTTIATEEFTATLVGFTAGNKRCIQFIVPANGSYQLVSAGTGTNTLDSVNELSL